MTLVLTVGAVALQMGILTSLYVGLRRDNLAAVINAAVAFCVAVIPVVLDLLIRTGVSSSSGLGSTLPLWMGLAGFLHTLGMLGLYESTGWWDHLTHTVSATLVAALVYAALMVVEWPAKGEGLTRTEIVVGTIGLTLVAGIFWELLELVARDLGDRYGINPVLVVYGVRDTVLDLGFDLVGALVVVGMDLRVFVPIAAAYPTETGSLLGAGVGVFIIGSVLMAVGLAVFGRERPWVER